MGRWLALGFAVLIVGCEQRTEPPARPPGKPVMRLELSSGTTIENPTDEQITAALRQLDVQRDGEGFAILGRDDLTYVQVSGDASIGFDMEYQEGSTKKHYRAAREGFTLEEVVRAMAQYRDGAIDWKDYGNWSRITW